eukprot:8463188-Pyramimonas_sp.AAC.1
MPDQSDTGSAGIFSEIIRPRRRTRRPNPQAPNGVMRSRGASLAPPAFDWSVVRIYPRFWRSIGPS